MLSTQFPRLATHFRWMAVTILSTTGATGAAQAEEPLPLSAIVVEGSRNSQIGIAEAASAGVVTQKQLEARTVYRPGELLEATPGLIVSQHSGEGKANQFYLRGINLDHGTDLRTTVDGMLVNERSHSHGQGWTDLNFLIPELAQRVEYRKGPYYAEQGDFASAGAVSVVYGNKLDAGIASVGLGQKGFRRTLLADSPKFANGTLLYAVELFHNDGPFVHPDDYRKANGVLRYSEGTESNGFNVSLMAYKARWNATDQIPQRAIDTGLLANRFDTLDPTDGGRAHRYSLSTGWQTATATTSTKFNAYVINNQLDLYSNFTYFLDNPINGDQFNQPDRRVQTAINASHTWKMPMMGRQSENTVGVQFQNDNIRNALYSTQARVRLSTTREDHIVETSLGVYAENATKWASWFRTVAGVREDFYRDKVTSNLQANSNKVSDHRVSPKISMIFGPWAKTEFFFNAGRGFHSNDARGATISVDPRDPTAVATREAPLVLSRGLEIGTRTEFVPGLQSSLSLYRLDFDSELLFKGDAGTTADTGRPSRRVGFEFSNYYKVTRWLTIDADIAFARARYRNLDPVGDRIPGSIEGVASLALAVDHLGHYFGGLQLRYFGPRPLIEDNTVRSDKTMTLNGRIGYRFSPKLRFELEGYNLTNRKDAAIDYYYASRLPNEPDDHVGTPGKHFHPIETRSFRVSMIANF
ncbi:MAG: TonB-dependent receptor [Burkholderiaceae bacterium]